MWDCHFSKKKWQETFKSVSEVRAQEMILQDFREAEHQPDEDDPRMSGVFIPSAESINAFSIY